MERRVSDLNQNITLGSLKFWLPIGIAFATIFMQVGMANQKLDTLIVQQSSLENKISAQQSTLNSLDVRITTNAVRIEQLEARTMPEAAKLK